MSLKLLIRYFLRGCLVTAPRSAHALHRWVVLSWIDRCCRSSSGPRARGPVALITLVGVLTSNVGGRSFVEFADWQLRRLPLVKRFTPRSGSGERLRRRQAALRRAGLGRHRSGSDVRARFVTRQGMARFGQPDAVAVYFPQSYTRRLPRDRSTRPRRRAGSPSSG